MLNSQTQIMADHAVLRDMHEGVHQEAQAYTARIRHKYVRPRARDALWCSPGGRASGGILGGNINMRGVFRCC